MEKSYANTSQIIRIVIQGPSYTSWSFYEAIKEVMILGFIRVRKYKPAGWVNYFNNDRFSLDEVLKNHKNVFYDGETIKQKSQINVYVNKIGTETTYFDTYQEAETFGLNIIRNNGLKMALVSEKK